MSLDGWRARLVLVAALVTVGVAIWAIALRGGDEPAATDSRPSPGSPSSETTLPGDPDRVLLEGFDEVAITVDPGDGGSPKAWCLLAALTAQQRGRGMMGVTDLQGYSGMVFVYDEDVDNGYFMRNTPMPLSIAWVAADGRVVTIKDMEPCEDREGCPIYPSEGAYRYAIEVAQGGLDELGITEDAMVSVGGRCAPTD